METLMIADKAIIVFFKIILSTLLLAWVVVAVMFVIDVWVQAWRFFWGIK